MKTDLINGKPLKSIILFALPFKISQSCKTTFSVPPSPIVLTITKTFSLFKLIPITPYTCFQLSEL